VSRRAGAVSSDVPTTVGTGATRRPREGAGAVSSDVPTLAEGRVGAGSATALTS
jgi:hypothetical protein